jgi:hypothetical protein
MKKKLYIFIILATFSCRAYTTTPLPQTDNSRWPWENKGDSASLSQIGLRVCYNHQREAFVMQQGNGESLYQLFATSRIKLSDKTSVWGDASYRSGTKYNVRWNSSADYDLLYPYVMADSVGGNLQTERYQFSGGYATMWGKFSVGGELSFRAEHEYRNIDPRPRNIVSDLSARIGASAPISGYNFGIDVNGEIYKQTSSVSFYREAGEISEFQMTGLGTYYERFVGSITQIYYSGSAIGTSIGLTPNDGNGFYCNGGIQSKQYKRIAASLNSLPLTTLYVMQYETQVGWMRQKGKQELNCFAGLRYEKRNGTEHVAGNASSSIYPVLLDLSMYHHYNADYFVGAALNGHNHIDWSVQAKAGYTDYDARYKYPERQLSYAKLYADLLLQISGKCSKHLLLSANLQGNYYANISSKIIMPYTDMEQSFVDMVDYTYRYSKANYSAVGANIRGDYKKPEWQLGVFAELGSKATICSENNTLLSFDLSIGITF